MKILFLSRKAWPHVGGVEKHILEVCKVIAKLGHKVVIVSENEINYPHIKIIGLIYIWFWLLNNRNLIENADIVHCHDVFIWYLPFRFFYPRKKIITTIHGLEWDHPLRILSILQKKVAIRLSNRSVGVGKFLEKYLGEKFDLITYGGSKNIESRMLKSRNSVVYVGRLEKNTGLRLFLKWLDRRNWLVDFCGDGELKRECLRYGKVHGFVNPLPFYKKAKICVPGGYLAALEAINANCKLKLFWNNVVKEDYWKISPFSTLKNKKLNDWAREQTWEKLANEYLDLYKCSDKSAK